MKRREFIKTTALGVTALTASRPARAGANETVRIAVAGLGRGRSLAKSFVTAKLNVHVVALCDVDPRRFGSTLKTVTDHQKLTPQTYLDYRRVLDDDSIDALAVATPDHWHVPLSIFSVLAGKDVYVEKPLSHTVAEGRLLVQLARKHHKIVQHGTQSRSGKYAIDAIEYLRSGSLGKIRMAKAINSQFRAPIGRKADTKPPNGVEYDIWLGPAPKRPFNPNRFHYNWHWNWEYGTGDIGNDGVHQLDIARWGLGVKAPNAVSCSGGQLFYDDDHQTPDTQIATFEYDESYLMFEMRLWTPYATEGHGNGNVFYGDNGTLSLGRNGWKVTFKDGKPGPGGPVTDRQAPHVANFVHCLRSRKFDSLNADVEEGHYSAMLAHLGNIACRVGRRLRFDPAAERFIDDTQADKYLTKQYRKPYQIPTTG